MITTKRQILYSSNQEVLELMPKFEGIEVISHINEASAIWALNKTPVIASSKPVANAIAIPSFHKDNFVDGFTRWSHYHGFECGEYATGEIYDTRSEPCVLCAIANHKGITPSTLVYNANCEEVDTIIYESANFIVVPELGSLKQGMLMVVPKEHRFLSIAQLDDNLFNEYYEVCADVELLLKGAFNGHSVCFFEHGSSPSGLSSHRKSIVHAHTHVVVDFLIEQKYLDMVQCKRVHDIRCARNVHYFAYRLKNELFCVYDTNVFVPRQFARQILSSDLGHAPEQYNWRKHAFNENIHKTLFFLHQFLTNNRINERIEERTKDFTKGFALREN